MSNLWLPAGREDRRTTAPEVRDPKGATAGYRFNGLDRKQVSDWDADNAFKNGYYANWLVNRAVNIIADTVAKLPFRAGLDSEEPSKYDLTAPLAKLLGPPPKGPNPELSARKMWKMAVVNYLITGRFGWEKEFASRSSNEVVALWPLAMGPFFPIPTDGGREYFSGFELEQSNGQSIGYTRKEVVYGWNPSPEDVRQPESMLRSLRLNVSILIQLDNYNYSFIMNDAKPATVVVHGPMQDQDSRSAFQRKFDSDFRGPTNANKTAFVEVDPDDDGNVTGMLDVKPIGVNARDSRLVEIYEQQLRAVSGGTGVPMALLDASGQTFDNAGQDAYNFHDITISPLLADLADHINRDLAPELGEEIGWFDISKVEALKPRVTTGVLFSDVAADLLIDERRAFVGLAPVDPAALAAEKQKAMEEAQAMMIATTPAPPPGTVTDKNGKEVSPKSSNAPETSNNAGQPKPTGQPTPDSKKRVGKALPAKASREDEDVDHRHGGAEDHAPVASGHAVGGSTGLAAALARARVGGVARTASILQRQLVRYDAHSSRATLTRAEGKRGRQAVDDNGDVRVELLYDPAFWIDEARAALEPALDLAIGLVAQAVEGLLPAVEPDELWRSDRAEALAKGLVEQRLTVMQDGLVAENMLDRVSAAHLPRSDRDVRELAALIYDDVVRHVAGVPRSDVRDLLVKLVSGDLDLDAAMKGLSE